MAGKKRKKHAINTMVRVNTVTNEKVEHESPSKRSSSSSLSSLSDIQGGNTVLKLSMGYLNLFRSNPDYNIVFFDPKYKQTITIPHKSLFNIFKKEELALVETPNYLTLRINSNEKKVEKFNSIDDIKKNQKYINLFNYIHTYSCICANSITVDISKFSMTKILKFLERDIYSIVRLLQINILSISITEIKSRHVRSNSMLRKAQSKELISAIIENEHSMIYYLKPSTDYAEKCRKGEFNDIDKQMDFVSDLADQIRKKMTDKKNEMEIYINNPVNKLIKINDTYIQKKALNMIDKEKSEASVKDINGNIVTIKPEDVNSLLNSKTFIQAKDDTNKIHFFDSNELVKLYAQWITIEKIYTIKSEDEQKEIQAKLYQLRPSHMKDVEVFQTELPKKQNEEEQKEEISKQENELVLDQDLEKKEVKKKPMLKGKRVLKSQPKKKRVLKIQRAIYKLIKID